MEPHNFNLFTFCVDSSLPSQHHLCSTEYVHFSCQMFVLESILRNYIIGPEKPGLLMAFLNYYEMWNLDLSPLSLCTERLYLVVYYMNVYGGVLQNNCYINTL